MWEHGATLYRGFFVGAERGTASAQDLRKL